MFSKDLPKGKPIVALDFDGVIHSYDSGWKGASVIPDPPVPGAMAFIDRLQSAGFEVAVYSSRSRYIFGRLAMKRWLERHLVAELGDGFGHDAYAMIRWPWMKPPAFLTIDDRAITFDGQWPTIGSLRAFKPWNKK